MATTRYRREDLLALRESPLVARPSSLPDIQQWIELPNDQRKQRKNDDGEDVSKRPGLAQMRSRQSQSGVLGDIFLGPKISFASASANRKDGERSVSEELKEKIERAGRDRSYRDRNPETNLNRRNPQDQPNGHADDNHRKIHNRRGSGGEGDRPRLKLRQRQADGEEYEELPTPRRAGLPDKIHRSWLRGSQADNDARPFSDKHDRDIAQDRSGKENRHEHKPSWLGDPLAHEDEAQAQTQQDFAAWKEMMKKGHTAKDCTSGIPVGEGFGVESTADEFNESIVSPATDQPLFGTYGEIQSEEKKPEEPKKAVKPIKVSRFFGGGAPKQQTSEPVDLESPKANAGPASPEQDENKRGFQNILQMLRTGGSISQGHSDSAFAPPSMQLPQHMKNTTPPSLNPPQTFDPPVQSPPEPPESVNARHQQKPSKSTIQTQPPPSRDTEFLINLMKQQQSRPPFQEGHIYGQNYNQRRDSDDIASLINGASPHPVKPRAPPPGFLANQQAFVHNNNIDMLPRDLPRDKPSDDHFNHPNVHLNDHHPNKHGLADFRFPPPPPHDFGPGPPNHQQRPLSGEGIPPPPGFGLRPGAPPGFPPMGHAQNAPLHQNAPPQMRGPPPMHFGGPPPPGFAPQPPPGIAHQHGGRRMPSGNIPPGFEMYGDLQRRGPPPPPQAGYAQYLQQGGGPAAYQGR